MKKYLALKSTALIHGKPFVSFLRLISTVKKVAYRLLVTTKLMSTLMTIGMVKVSDIIFTCPVSLHYSEIEIFQTSDTDFFLNILFILMIINLIVFLKKKCSSLIYGRVFITSTVPM